MNEFMKSAGDAIAESGHILESTQVTLYENWDIYIKETLCGSVAQGKHKKIKGDKLVNMCIHGTIDTGVETLRARVKHNMARGASKFCSEWKLTDAGNNEFIWLGNITDI